MKLLKRLNLILLAGTLLALAAVPSAFGVNLAHAQGKFNQPGNILITDQFNNRVIEISPSGSIVWTFGNGPHDASANAIAGTNDAERIPGGLTLISGTGVPAGTTKSCKAGCVDNRVLIVDRGDNIIWQYGQFGVSGFGPNQLNVPVQNTYLPVGLTGTPSVLITDQSNERIIEVRISDHAIIWQYGQNGNMGSGDNQLNNPNAAELLDNGNILISDENNNRAIEVTHTTPSIIKQTFTAGGTTSGVAFASRLSNGDTLITDSNNARIVEVNAADSIVGQYSTNRTGGNPNPLPTRAVKLSNGNILISDQFNDQVIEITSITSTMPPTIVASYGTINVLGFSPSSASVMNAPYSAYVIGDYTGLTIP